MNICKRQIWNKKSKWRTDNRNCTLLSFSQASRPRQLTVCLPATLSEGIVLCVMYVESVNAPSPPLNARLNIVCLVLYTQDGAQWHANHAHWVAYMYAPFVYANTTHTALPEIVEGLYCKRPIQRLASSKILTPHRPASVYPPSPLVRGEHTLAGWRGGGGSIVWKTPDTALYSIIYKNYVPEMIALLVFLAGCCWTEPVFENS
jgi:hypothetical protein